MSDDPIRWAEASDAPSGALDLVRSLERPPALPPDLSALVRRRVVRPRVPRWIAPGVAASAVVAGGIVLWAWSSPAPERPPAIVTEPAPVAPAEPVVADVEAPAAPPEEIATPREAQRPIARPRGMGSLLVQTIPGARVYIDGRLVGNTPLRLRVRAGPHRVELVAEDHRRTTVMVEIAPDQEARILRRLRPDIDYNDPWAR